MNENFYYFASYTAALAAGLTEDQVNLITEEDQGYVLKLKAVEWWEEMRARLEGPRD